MCRVAAKNFPELYFILLYFDFYCTLPTLPQDQNAEFSVQAVWSSPRWFPWIWRWFRNATAPLLGVNPSWMWGIPPQELLGNFSGGNLPCIPKFCLRKHSFLLFLFLPIPSECGSFVSFIPKGSRWEIEEAGMGKKPIRPQSPTMQEEKVTLLRVAAPLSLQDMNSVCQRDGDGSSALSKGQHILCGMGIRPPDPPQIQPQTPERG